MNIKTKFYVHDLVKRKFDVTREDEIHLLEVMEVLTQTCYAGTQVFYLCRQIRAHKRHGVLSEKYGYKWEIGHGIGSQNDDAGWRKYREDELIEPPQKHVDLIDNGGEEN